MPNSVLRLLLHIAKGLTPEAVVTAVDRATERSIAATGIDSRLILCTLRHFSQDQSMLTAQLVEQFKGTRVVALDLAGDEAGYPIAAHIPAFHYAGDHDLNRTAHAGEACGADSVWETLRAFRPSRIGHGVRSIEDSLLIDHLRREHIHLEVCPTSNVQTRVCPTYQDHPVDRLFRSGVSLGINTDARTITNVTLDQEYTRLRQNFDWNQEELMICNRAALQASFL
jgi:adenosine deaminase